MAHSQSCLLVRIRGFRESAKLLWRTKASKEASFFATLAQEQQKVKNGDPVEAKPFSSIPRPPSLPLFGHTYLYRGLGPYRIERYHEALRSLYKRYGSVFRQQLQGGAQGTAVHVFELKDVEKVLHAALSRPLVPPIQEGSRLYRLSRGHAVGLGNMNGAEWKTLRRAAQQALLQTRRVENHLPGADRLAIDFVRQIDDSKDDQGRVGSLHNLLSRWFLDTAGDILFEKSVGGLSGSDQAQIEAGKWIQSNMDIFTYNARLKVASPLFKIFPIKPWRKLVEAEETFHYITARHLKIAMREIKSLSSMKKLEGLFTLLVDLMSREEVDHKDLVFFVNSMVSEGLATVPSTVQSAIQCLANDPKVQEKSYQEVRKALGGDPNQPITPEIVSKLPYLKAVVKETFRMYPLGTEVSRILPYDMVLGGYLVPAGTVVELNHSSLLKSERYFPEPLKFKPERWMRGSEEATENAILLTPFGHGPRMCVGRRISQQAMYVGLARILQRYSLVNPQDDPPYGQIYRTLLFPDRDLRTAFLPRK